MESRADTDGLVSCPRSGMSDVPTAWLFSQVKSPSFPLLISEQKLFLSLPIHLPFFCLRCQPFPQRRKNASVAELVSLELPHALWRAWSCGSVPKLSCSSKGLVKRQSKLSPTTTPNASPSPLFRPTAKGEVKIYA